MDLGIAGKKAIVCASSKGIGKGCAAALAEAGCDVVINGRTEASLEAAARDLADTHKVKVTPVAADVSTPDGQKALIAACPDADILINNNAGPVRRPFEDLTRERILDGVIQNMITPIELVQAVLPGMRERRFGRILSITSLAVYSPSVRNTLSSGARAGLTSLLAGVARAVAADNVTINFVLPGKIETERLREGFEYDAGRHGGTAADFASRAVADVPAGRFGTPEEFGHFCAFLSSVHAGYLTGQNFRVDGGLFKSAF